jgi:tetratricopeptide (TPR) repeat protein
VVVTMMVSATDAKTTLIKETDLLHASSQVADLFDSLVGADKSDDDIAWRMARAYHDKAEETVGDDATREALLRDGLAIAEAAKERSESGPSLKWYAILLGRLGDYLPTKEKVANSYKIKEALEASALLLADDASVQTALGQWCFKVAGISWVERQAAKLLFGSPPESSYEEALSFAQRSFELRPSKKAAFLAGESCAKQGKPDEGAAWMKRVLELPSAGEADAAIDRQATEALR